MSFAHTRRQPAAHAGRGRPMRSGSRRAALSLAEMMIAIVILGLGLIMVATLFPVSWTRARELAEYTVQSNVTNQAAMLVQAAGRVDILRSPVTHEEVDTPGFKGDQAHFRYGAPPGLEGDLPPNARVHALNLQNITVDDRAFVAEDPHQLDPADPVEYGVYQNAVDDFRDRYDVSYFRPLLGFHERVYPPLRPRLDELDLETPGRDDAWDAQMESRRYVFAVFHRLNDDYVYNVIEDALNNGRIGNLMGLTRDFTMYYVTLRRPRPTQRFARQDPAETPNRNELNKPVQPKALPPSQDVMFPVAWRVQIALPDPDTIQPALSATGIPTELAVNIDPFTGYTESLWDNDATIVEMFRSGAAFIDEKSGQVFRIEKRRLAGDNDQQAWITVDREILVQDVNDNRNEGIDLESEVLRVVWVFPPSVKRRSSASGTLEFDGSQPVVGIDVRSLIVPPTR